MKKMKQPRFWFGPSQNPVRLWLDSDWILNQNPIRIQSDSDWIQSESDSESSQSLTQDSDWILTWFCFVFFIMLSKNTCFFNDFAKHFNLITSQNPVRIQSDSDWILTQNLTAFQSKSDWVQSESDSESSQNLTQDSDWILTGFWLVFYDFIEKHMFFSMILLEIEI